MPATDILPAGQLCKLTSRRFPKGVTAIVRHRIADTNCYLVETGTPDYLGRRKQAYGTRRELNKLTPVT